MDNIKNIIILKLKNLGLKLTKQREVIIDVLIKNKNVHLNLEQIYNKAKDYYSNISPATIYRNITYLEKKGIIKKFISYDKKSYYEIEDLYLNQSINHHDHFFCLKCGSIIEFYCKEIEILQEQIAQKYNFKTFNHKLEIFGECANCSKNNN